MPSKTFLVQQSILTVAYMRYPLSIVSDGRAQVMDRMRRLIENEFQEGMEFCDSVRSEYRALSNREANYAP